MALQDGNMTVNERDGVVYLTFKAYDDMDFIKHCFSTKIGGVSKGIFESMNLSFNRGDDDKNVRENYRRICAAIGCDYKDTVFSAQDHHTFVRLVTEADKGIGIWRERDMQSVDGLITNQPGLLLVTHYADCVPLYFVDPVKHAIGLSHGGWRGTADRIAEVTVKRMQECFDTEPADLVCAIGPSIGQCCYEVDRDCMEHFAVLPMIDKQRCIIPKGNEKYHLDLWEINREILIASGVKPENITVSNICTRCNSDTLFSHRATSGKRGGLAAFLSLC